MSRFFVLSRACAGALIVAGFATQRLGGQNPALHPVASTPWPGAQAGWAGRLVIGEYGTGSACVGCHFIEETVRGLMQRYPATTYLALSYHMKYDLLLSDPADSVWMEERHWYGFDAGCKGGQDAGRADETWGGQLPLPCNRWVGLIVDGRSAISWSRADTMLTDASSQQWYAQNAAAIDAELQRAPEAVFHAWTGVDGGQVGVQVRVTALRGRHAQLALRLILVADTVRLHPKELRAGPLGDLEREQHMVVYDAAHTPALALGLPLPGLGTYTYTFDVAALQRRLLAVRRGAMAETGLDATWSPGGLVDYSADLPDDRDWRLDSRRLHVVVLVQDVHSGAVLQAALVPIDGRRLTLPQ